MNIVKNFLLDETGMELSEFAVAAALITLVIITAFTDLGSTIAVRIGVLKDRVSP